MTGERAISGGADATTRIWRVSVTYVVHFTAIGALFPYLPVYYRGLGLDLATIGLLASLAAGIQLVVAPLWGALTDRFAHTRMTLPAAAIVASGGAVALVSANGLPAVIGGAALLAVGMSGVGTLLDARALETLGSDRIRYGQIRAWGSLAFTFVALGVGVLIDRAGAHALFFVCVPALLATAVVSMSLARRRTVRTVHVFRGVSALIRSPGTGFFLLGVLLVWTMLTAVTAFFSIQVEALGGGAQTVGLSWAVGAMVEVPLMWSFPRLARRFGTERLLVVGAACFAIRALGAAAASDPTVLVAIGLVEGTAFGLFFVGGVTFMSSRAPAGFAATAQGIFVGVAGLGTIFGSAIGGFLADVLGIRGLFAVCGASGFLAALVILAAVRIPTPVLLAKPGPERVEGAGRPERPEERWPGAPEPEEPALEPMEGEALQVLSPDLGSGKEKTGPDRTVRARIESLL